MNVDVYAVGILREWQRLRWRGLARTARYLWYQARRCEWRAVRNTPNRNLAGYPPAYWHALGEGWYVLAEAERVAGAM